jgi:tetratricopeptide (TPR) repeat protein
MSVVSLLFILLSALPPITATGGIVSTTSTGAPSVSTNEAFARIIQQLEEEAQPESEALGRISFARTLRGEQKHDIAEKILIGLLRRELNPAEKQSAYLELATTLQESHQYGKAQQVYSEYTRQFPNDGSVPEVLLKQGRLYRDMGLNVMALSKFYGVISSCLNLKAEDVDRYQNLVTQAQVEIAESYYLQENYSEAVQFYGRILKQAGRELKRNEVLYRVVRCHFALAQWDQSVANARLFLEKAPEHGDAPEVRYCLAEALKKLGRNEEALAEVMTLLQAQEKNSRSNPERWEYWQRRTGRDIVNQLMKEGDYTNALEVCLQLVQLDTTPEWQLPIFYQVGLIYEALHQPASAIEMFDKILAAEKPSSDPQSDKKALNPLARMAKWRKEYVIWEGQARKENERFASAEPAPNSEKSNPSNAPRAN